MLGVEIVNLCIFILNVEKNHQIDFQLLRSKVKVVILRSWCELVGAVHDELCRISSKVKENPIGSELQRSTVKIAVKI